MGFKGTTVSFSLAIVVTFLLLSSAAAGSRKPKVNPFCKSADNKALCTEMTKGATTWPKAMTNMITVVIQKAKAQKPMAYGIAAKLSDDLLPRSKKSIDSTCKENFDTLISNLKECLGFIKSDPTSALRHYISTVTFFDCRNALEEFGVSLNEVNEFDDELVEMSTSLAAVLQENRAHK